MNRTIKIIISVVLCVWIFAMGLELGAYRERKAINATLSGNNPVSSATTTTKPSNNNIVIETPSSTQPQTSEAQKPADDTTTTAPSETTETTESTKPTEENQPASTIPQTNEEIAAAFNKAMNATKHSTKSCNAVKNTDVKIQVTDCSVPSLTGMVNSIAQRFTGPETAEYSFVDGKATTSDGEITINNDFPPSNRDTALDAGGIAKASAEPYGDGGYKLSITLIPETSSLGNEPKYHANTVGYLDIEGLGISGVTFTEANFTYPGATVIISVNGDGLVEKYDCTLPMSGTGAGSIKIASASATLEGSSTENWQFTWL
ncbi:MAG: hypothetical protein ACI4F5_06910 [Acutalibacteraceae bacterium]